MTAEPLSIADTVSLTVNGREVTARGVTPHTTLLGWLRSQGLTGSKEGCAEGECGACAVLVVTPRGVGGEEGSRLTAVNSCLVMLGALAGAEVVTVEGLGDVGKLHPAQAALAAGGGSQCGYCTPGFVVSLAGEYYRPEREGGCETEALSGNLCRCTGYRPIADAAHSLGRPGEGDPFAARLEAPAPVIQPGQLRADTGTLHRPASLQGALDLLAQFPDAKVLAGGTDWGVEVNLFGRRDEQTIFVGHLPELRAFEVTQTHLTLGAALSLSEIERAARGVVPLLDRWLPLFASPLIRGSATLGGNLGTASPIGDSPPVLLALEASVVLTGPGGEREVPLDAYFTGYRETVRRPGELIRSVRIPLPPAPIARFHKVAKRPADDISSVAAAFALHVEGGMVTQARIGLGGVAATPIRARAAEEALEGRAWTLETARAAARLMSEGATPLSDHRASAEYRAAMLGQLLLKFWHETQGEAE